MTLQCESDGSYRRCPASGSWRGARLIQQLSKTPCLQDRNWGFDHNAVWVNDGCRGVFDAGNPYTSVGGQVTCASGGSRTECPADTRYGVRLVRQLSNATCTEGRTWGTSRDAVWVDRGCRAEFVVGQGSGGGGGTAGQITCGAPSGQQVTCRTNGYATRVRLVRDLSGGRCRQGSTWGYTDSFIWANRGCRAEFGVTYGGGAGSDLIQRARRACETKVLNTGYGSVRVDNARQSGDNVIVNARATDAGRDWDIECTYRTAMGTAMLTRVGEAGGPGGGGNQYDLFARAQRACENEARRQGYEVVRSGPGKPQSWGVQHHLALRRGGQTYSQATCNYLSADNRATLASGPADRVPAQPR